ncbi:hypothetical protein RCL1_002236 [Eukaryota sp. TZLM3-RCL]
MELFSQMSSFFFNIEHLFSWSTQSFSSSSDELLDNLKQLHSFVERNSLFSFNEELDDVSTEHIPLLLCHYFLGCYYSSHMGDDRLISIQKSHEHFSHFISMILSYRITTIEFLTSLGFSEDTYTVPQIHDPYIKRQYLSLRSSKIKQIVSTVCKPVDVLKMDEEDVRLYYNSKLQLAAVSTIKILAQLQQEKEMLLSVKAVESQGRNVLEEYRQEKLALEASATKPLRSQLKDQVFDVSHRLWTMTSEQADEKEANEIFAKWEADKQAKIAKQLEETQKRESTFILDSTVDPDDHETYKQRAWDDWKDDNPKGIGNSQKRK